MSAIGNDSKIKPSIKLHSILLNLVAFTMVSCVIQYIHPVCVCSAQSKQYSKSIECKITRKLHSYVFYTCETNAARHIATTPSGAPYTVL